MHSTSAPIGFLHRAKPLIDRGFSVLPLAERGKAPVPGKGARSASNNADIIAHWSEIYPVANVGIASDANFTLLETDDEAKFRSLVRSETGKELPETLQLGSGRPNRCCWIFKRTAVCGDDCLELPGIFEFRNRNQYVAAPGSIHPDGHVYRWLNEAPVIEFPDWLMPALTKLSKAYKGEATHDHVKTGPARLLRNEYSMDLDPEAMFGMDLTIGDGERHYALQSAAGFLHDGERDADDIYEILIRLRDEYCSPGKGDDELRRIADDIVHRKPCQLEPQRPGWHIGLVIYPDQASYDAAMKERVEGWRGLFHTRAEAENAPPLEFVIEGFLQKDAITLIGGPPAAMKTYAALSVAKALLTEELLFDYFQVNEPANRVLYLIPESSISAFTARLKKLGLMRFVERTFFFRTFNAAEINVPITDPRILKAAEGADVFLDTAVRFMEGDENTSGDQRVFAENLFGLLRAGARSVVGLHHAPKAFGAANSLTLENVLRGSGDIGAMAATVWGLSKIDAEKSQIYIECVKDRDFRESPKPFIVEGRPHIDETGKFKLLHAPGNAPEYSKIKQKGRGAKGGRPKNEVPEEVKSKVWELHKAGKSYREIMDATGLSKRGVGDIIIVAQARADASREFKIPLPIHAPLAPWQAADVARAAVTRGVDIPQLTQYESR